MSGYSTPGDPRYVDPSNFSPKDTPFGGVVPSDNPGGVFNHPSMLWRPWGQDYDTLKNDNDMFQDSDDDMAGA